MKIDFFCFREGKLIIRSFLSQSLDLFQWFFDVCHELSHGRRNVKAFDPLEGASPSSLTLRWFGYRSVHDEVSFFSVGVTFRFGGGGISKLAFDAEELTEAEAEAEADEEVLVLERNLAALGVLLRFEER